MAAFEVDVEGVTYEVDAPDENTAWVWANQTHRQQAAPVAQEKPTKSGVTISDVGRWVAEPWKNLGSLVTEVPTTLATGMGSMLAGNIMGAASNLYSSATGQPRVGEQVREDVMQKFTYQPRSGVAKEALGKLSQAMESEAGKLVQGLPIAGQELPMLAKAARQGVPAAAELTSARLATPSEQVMQVAAQRPELVEAAKNARLLDLRVDPGQVNPTLKNRVVTGFARPEIVDLKASEINLPKVRDILRQEAGIEGNMLTKSAFKNARLVIARPYNAIRQIGQLKGNAEIAAAIRNATPTPITGLENQVKQINKQAAKVADAVEQGQSASQIIEDIRGYRSMAQNFYKIADKGDAKRNPKPLADAYQRMADLLEDYVESNLPKDSRLRSDFVAARRDLAKNYTVERLVDTESGLPDLARFNNASLVDAPLTGNVATLKNVYSNFPEAFQTLNKYGGAIPKTISRATASGTTGAAAAMAAGGSPGLGAIVGSLTGLVGGRQAANLAVSQAYQTKNLVPNVPGPRRTMPQGFQLAPQAMPQLNLPGREQPLSIPEAPPLVPGSWRGMLSDQPQQSPLPVLPDDLLPIAQRYAGTDMPIGLVEGGGPATTNTPLPKLPPMERGLLGLGEAPSPIPDTRRLATRHDVPTMELQLHQEVLQQPAIRSAIEAFTTEAERLRGLAKSAGGFWQKRYAADLAKLEDEFAAGMRQLGIRSREEALGLVKLYESGGQPRLPIERGYSR